MKDSNDPNYYLKMIWATGDTKQYICFLAKHAYVNRGESETLSR